MKGEDGVVKSVYMANTDDVCAPIDELIMVASCQRLKAHTIRRDERNLDSIPHVD